MLEIWYISASLALGRGNKTRTSCINPRTTTRLKASLEGLGIGNLKENEYINTNVTIYNYIDLGGYNA